MTPDKATALREAAERDWEPMPEVDAVTLVAKPEPTMKALLAERERLRGALEKIADTDGVWRIGDNPGEIARQALETTHDQT